MASLVPHFSISPTTRRSLSLSLSFLSRFLPLFSRSFAPGRPPGDIGTTAELPINNWLLNYYRAFQSLCTLADLGRAVVCVEASIAPKGGCFARRLSSYENISVPFGTRAENVSFCGLRSRRMFYVRLRDIRPFTFQSRSDIGCMLR